MRRPPDTPRSRSSRGVARTHTFSRRGGRMSPVTARNFSPPCLRFSPNERALRILLMPTMQQMASRIRTSFLLTLLIRACNIAGSIMYLNRLPTDRREKFRVQAATRRNRCVRNLATALRRAHKKRFRNCLPKLPPRVPNVLSRFLLTSAQTAFPVKACERSPVSTSESPRNWCKANSAPSAALI